MRLSRFYELAIKCGIRRDPRRKKPGSFPDSLILNGPLDAQVKKILVGIDVEAPELLLADRIRQSEGLDLVLGHHPEGRGYSLLSEVMSLQVDLLKGAGVDARVASKLLEQRQEEVSRRILSQNHTRAVDAAKLLKIPFICLHTAADNHVYAFLKKTLEAARPVTVQDVIGLLKEIPEYKLAQRHCAGPRLIAGGPNRRAGKILYEMTGGTEGPKEVFDKLYKAGVRTLVSMHLSEEHLKKALESNLNVVIAGHISSDTLGLNLLLDAVEKEARERFEVIGCSGFTRVRR
jgi:putative NIF3 family GTP cyclohydrolase 1 type 2